MSLFKPLKGNSSNLPKTLTEGWAYFCTDTGEFFIDYKDTDGELKRKQLNADDAKTLLGCSVEQALSGLPGKIPSSEAVQNALAKQILEHNTATNAHQDIRDAIPEIPTNISEFINDAGYVDKDEAQEAVLIELGSLASKDVVEIGDLPTELQGALTAKGLLKGTDNGIHAAEADVDYATPAYVKSCADEVKDDLLSGAGPAYDTLKELGDLIDQNHDAIDALEEIASSKVSTEELSAQLGSHNAAADAHEDIRKELADQKTAGLYIPAVQATSTDGLNYAGTLDGVDELTNGLLVVMQPLSENTSSGNVTFNLNEFGEIPLVHMGVLDGKRLGCSIANVCGPYAFGYSQKMPVLLRYTNVVYQGGAWIAVEYPHIDTNSVYVHFDEATTRENFNSGETVSELFGKAKKWFSDLEPMAFKSTVAKDDLASDVQASLDKVDSAQPQITAIGILVGDGSGGVSAQPVDTIPTDGSENLVQSGGVSTALAEKMSTADPVGTGSFSLNRKQGSTVGAYSVAEGRNTTASGDYSHAEGSNTEASALYTHAEGGSTKAQAMYAHAEGGSSIAAGKYSHAEGRNTTARGQCSHTEGYYTIAQGQSQHVQGEYNVLDADDSSSSKRGKYASIVGNGTSTSARSNAHTLDWSGNAWFAGDVYVGSSGGTNQDAGSKKLATTEDVAVAVANASGVRTAYIEITSDQWVDTETEYTLTIPDSTHGMNNPKRTMMQIQSPDGPGPATWRSTETYMTVAEDNSIVLHASSAFDGAVLLIG